MEFLIADTHFHHKKIIEFEVGRSNEFNDVEQMDNEMISNWNNTVGEQDTIYFLGDLSIKSDYKVLRLLLSKLNGHIIHILGNHDSAKTARRLKEDGLIFDYHEVGLRLKIQKHILYLTHYPMMIGDRDRIWNIHGHIHSTPSYESQHINVGVDSKHMLKDFKRPYGSPVAMDDILNHIRKEEQ
ncbi:metallophosphoesterase [Kurthia sp. Dielmo]|uniref:metallophosphoesterase n=1 Tax=Kurthia sp. Dielmo TaxID=1033738 RepID=UPI0011227272|nr:metallophosphoesterase [Kurthia sp. Dielmo]